MIEILQGDCLELMRGLADNSVDAVVTDPPYGLEFMGVAWDTFSTPKGGQRTENTWKDHGSREHPRDATTQARIQRNKGIAFQDFTLAWASEAMRVLKPGGHLLAFSGSRTYHRMACAIEDAGLEIRDQIMWVYGSGFPKSLDVSKAIDKAAGAEREVVAVNKSALRPNRKGRKYVGGGTTGGFHEDNGATITAPATEAAKQWQGWGTALKPAHEPIVVARKLLSEKNVAANVLEHGTGALNIDGCRIGTSKNVPASISKKAPANCYGKYSESGETPGVGGHDPNLGRWPANLIHDGSDEVVGLFPVTTNISKGIRGSDAGNTMYGGGKGLQRPSTGQEVGYGDSGSAARFFYCPKASRSERNGSKHPTVKPVALMRYLVRLITPPSGTVLDPFAGSGTTGEAALLEGMNAILIEREQKYIETIKRRLAQPRAA